MTQPGIEPWSPGPLANTLLIRPNGPGDLGSILGHVILKTFKMVLDTSLLNTKQHKVRIKGKVSNPGKGVALSNCLLRIIIIISYLKPYNCSNK